MRLPPNSILRSYQRSVSIRPGVGAPTVLADSTTHDGGWVVRWSLDDSGRVSLLASDPSGAVVLDLPSVVREAR